MAYQVKLTARAEADAYEAYGYLRQFAPERAEKWLHGLFETIFSFVALSATISLG